MIEDILMAIAEMFCSYSVTLAYLLGTVLLEELPDVAPPAPAQLVQASFLEFDALSSLIGSTVGHRMMVTRESEIGQVCRLRMQ